MRITQFFAVLATGALVFATNAFALDAALQSKLDATKATVGSWGKDPTLVAAVKAANAAPPESAMTQVDWEKLTVLDPKVRQFQSNEVGAFLKAKKADWVSEAFVSTSSGSKVGFLTKPSSWSHSGKPKHDKPMKGESWQGELEVDQSAGKQQIQVSVPVMDGASPIGSLVVGIDVSKLKG